MRIISGTVRSTPTAWLSPLANIAPADLRRKKALLREYWKITNSPDLPVYVDLQDLPPSRLRSRNPPFASAKSLAQDDFSLNDAWKERWNSAGLGNLLFEFDKDRTTEFELPRRCFVNLNRLRTRHGCCNEMLHKWGYLGSPVCDKCGHITQSMDHIWLDCPVMKYQGPVVDISNLDENAIEWLKKLKL